MDGLNNYYQDVLSSNRFSYFTPEPPPVREREQMFEKVLTPSDVGKLNRLVIPKHHAEKHFPLDRSMSSAEKDARQSLILNFEDGSGMPWRFRYSYWSSSQSYVLTKGWNRFVREKELGAGDIVSFEKETSGLRRFFIDFHRCTNVGAVHLRPVFLPTPSSSYYHTNFYNRLDPASLDHAPSFGLREGMPAMILDSVPVVPGRMPTTLKSVKLFGVDLECPVSEDGGECSSSSSNHNFPTMVHDQLLPSPSMDLMSEDLLNSPDLSLSLKSDS